MPVIAVADVDAMHTRVLEKVNKHYMNEDCKGYQDFRDLIGRKDIDAVCISTPDHWHAIPAVMAANAKKDIFCEKPLSHTFAEGVAMVNATLKNERVWQTGSWQRSVPNFRHGCELVLNGYIGKIKRVEVGLPAGHSDFDKTGKDNPNSEPPAGVDYDFWVGPSQFLPFNASRFHKNWRWSYEFGGGQLLDWIGHHGDIAHWGLTSAKYGAGIADSDLGPLEVPPRPTSRPKTSGTPPPSTASNASIPTTSSWSSLADTPISRAAPNGSARMAGFQWTAASSKHPSLAGRKKSWLARRIRILRCCCPSLRAISVNSSTA